MSVKNTEKCFNFHFRNNQLAMWLPSYTCVTLAWGVAPKEKNTYTTTCTRTHVYTHKHMFLHTCANCFSACALTSGDGSKV